MLENSGIIDISKISLQNIILSSFKQSFRLQRANHSIYYRLKKGMVIPVFSSFSKRRKSPLPKF
jgi:hypothetical protein